MDVLPDIQKFVLQLEDFAKHRINYPSEIGELLQIAMQTGSITEFEELIFQAKFLVKTHGIINRTGPGGEGFQKLSAEFTAGMGKTIDIIERIVEKSTKKTSAKYHDVFLNKKSDGMLKLMDLLVDLNWIKNWQVDGKPLPYNK